MHSSSNELPDIQSRLKAAVQFARTTCILGSSNIASDIEKTGAWVLNQKARYDDGSGSYVTASQVSKIPQRGNYVFDPTTGKISANKKKTWHYEANRKQNSIGISLHHRFKDQDPLKALPDRHQEVLRAYLKTSATRQGNCLELSCLIAKYLWERPLNIKKIEIVQFFTFDHVVVIVNRAGDISNPSSWGKDCYVVDGLCSSQPEEKQKSDTSLTTKFKNLFLKNKNQTNEQYFPEPEPNTVGIIFPGIEFDQGMEKMKAFFIENNKRLEEIGMPSLKVPQKEVLKAENIYTTIIPETHIYPASFEACYEVYSTYPQSEQKTENGTSFFAKEKNKQQTNLLTGLADTPKLKNTPKK